MKITILTVALASIFLASCKLFSGGDQDTRGSVVAQKAREVQLDGNSDKLFDILTGKSTGLTFVNDLTENYEVNWWRYSYIYNGGGVCVGDVNNDGLQDIFFVGNLVPCRLFLNKGDLKFEDYSGPSGIVKGEWDWPYGSSMVDVDGDGDLDIYICMSRWDDPEKRVNQLWLNNGDATFVLADNANGLMAKDSYSTHANFFDYDNDGDLDCYLVTHPVDFIDKNKTKYFQKIEQGKNLSNKFFINNGDGTWTESHLKVGINNHGYGLSATVGDINDDGYLDVFVANDYAMYDYIYVNNGDGTFRDESLIATKKTSINSMGSDISDFNNDGFLDMLVVDMDMEDNYTYKTFMLSSQVEVMRILINAGYGYQNRSNSLQLNNGDGTFSEISRTAGISSTDWSWTSFFADFDNDGWKDLFIGNGFLRDFHVDESETYHKLRRAVRIEDSTVYYEVRKELPTYVLNHPNYIFKNNGDLTFSDMRDEWGIYYPSITYGGGAADFDNDGDLDIVISNVNETPWIYRNNSEKLHAGNNWIDFHFKGYAKNSGGLGTKVRIYCNGQEQYIQHTASRGYITTVQNDCHFGLGKADKIDMVEVEWLDGTKQVLRDVAVNQVVVLDHANASKSTQFDKHEMMAATFTNVSATSGADFEHKETNYDDFLREFLLPHKMSTLGPGIAVADVNGDGMQDFYIGGASEQSGALYMQTADGKFKDSGWKQDASNGLNSEDMGVLFFDANGDGAPDLYVASGSNEFADQDQRYADRLYMNDGKGGFTYKADALPKTFTSSSTVTAADYDGDGDMDLFVGGRQVPGKYLAPTSSYILQNNNGTFTDVTDQVAPMLNNIGMVTSAVWTDFNNDGKQDIILTGDWMPVTFLQNNGGKFTNVTESTGLAKQTGWWQSIAGADLDNDGDMDYVVGNFGTNRRYKNTVSVVDGHALPLEGYLADFDDNGSEDFILAYYQHDNNYPFTHDFLYPVKTRERMIEQIPDIDTKFPTWDSYGKSTVQEIFGDKLDKAIHRDAYVFHSSVLMNEGNGKFTMKYLPNIAQISTMFGFVVDDFNGDGHADILMHGNFYNTEIETTRHDAGTGLLLLGKGDGTFTPVRSFVSGFKNDADAKGLACILTGKNQQPEYLCANSNGKMKSFALTTNVKTLALASTDAYALITRKDGSVAKMECYKGSGYLSQNAIFVRLTDDITMVEAVDYKGNKRTIFPAATASR
ncbi:MAG: VCBS repeat-containing protein [Chitinophagales bacterium]